MALLRKLAAGGSLAVAAHAAASDKWQETLMVHNMFRCMHGMNDLVWDPDIAATAQAWADQGESRNSMAGTQYRANGVGENLATSSDQQFDGAAATALWYGEVLYTPEERYGKPLSPSDTSVPNEIIASYTGMIWKDATKLGCGQGNVTWNGDVLVSIVCQYGTVEGGMAPNMLTQEGLFADPDQVAGPSRTYAECAAKCPDGCEKYVPEPQTHVLNPGAPENVHISGCERPVVPASLAIAATTLLLQALH